MSATLTYVYAVLRDTGAERDDHPGDGVRGVAGSAVRGIAAAGLRAVVSDVDRAVFEEQALADHLDDLTWLAATAREHHRVIDAVARHRVVAPLALGTVYWDDDRARAVLTADRDRFVGVLDRVEGRAEYGVKVYARRPDAAATERPGSGAAYLRARRRALRDDQDDADRATRAAEAVDRAVAALAVDSRTRPLQDAGLSGVTERMVLNRTYLVPVERGDDLASVVARAGYDDPRLRVELTGPWAPYSFAGGDA